MSEAAEAIREGIREDGTVEGCAVETHWLPLESAAVDVRGFFRFVGDGGPVNYEIRVPWGPICYALNYPGSRAEIRSLIEDACSEATRTDLRKRRSVDDIMESTVDRIFDALKRPASDRIDYPDPERR